MSCHAAQQIDLQGYGHTWVHHLDPRFKLIATALFILCVASFQKYAVSELIPFFLFPIVLGCAGRVAFRPLWRLLLWASPFAVLVGVFNPLMDQRPVLQVGGWVMTGGWLSFLSILLRFLLSAGMVLVLISVTSLPRLLHALVLLRCPRPFVTQLHFLYRYLFLLIREGQQIARARQVRDPSHRLPSLRTAEHMLSGLLGRAWTRAFRVYHGLQCRGFSGDFPPMERDHTHRADWFFLVLACAACLVVRFLPVMQWLGSQVVRRMT